MRLQADARCSLSRKATAARARVIRTVVPTDGHFPGLYLEVIDALSEVHARVLVTVGRHADVLRLDEAVARILEAPGYRATAGPVAAEVPRCRSSRRRPRT